MSFGTSQNWKTSSTSLVKVNYFGESQETQIWKHHLYSLATLEPYPKGQKNCAEIEGNISEFLFGTSHLEQRNMHCGNARKEPAELLEPIRVAWCENWKTSFVGGKTRLGV